MTVAQSELISDIIHRMVNDALTPFGFDELEPIVTNNDEGVGTTWAWEDSVGSNNGNTVHYRVSFEIQADYYNSLNSEITAEAVPHTIPYRNHAWNRQRVVLRLQGRRDETMGPLYFPKDVEDEIRKQLTLAWEEAFAKATKISQHIRNKHM